MYVWTGLIILSVIMTVVTNIVMQQIATQLGG
jgi:hypothetical protein